MPMVHLVGSFDNKATVLEVAKRLAADGFNFTYDWNPVASAAELDRMRAELGAYLYQADVAVVVLPGGRGSHVELGRAIECGKPIVLFARDRKALFNPNDGRTCSYYGHIAVTQVVGEIEPIPRLARQAIYRATGRVVE